MFEKLKQLEPAAAKAVCDLDAGDMELAERLRNFASAVENVLGEQDMPRETLSRAVCISGSS